MRTVAGGLKVRDRNMSDYGYGYSEEHRPVTYWRGYPVYAAHLVVAAYSLSMVVYSLLFAAGAAGFYRWFVFDSAQFWQGQVWRAAAYGLVNPASISFAIDMVMIVWFGREVERAIGRNKFLWLFAGIYGLRPLVGALWGLVQPVTFAGEFGALAIFVAFATLHPGAPVFFSLIAQWAAVILVGIFSLMALMARDIAGLLALWATCGLAWAMIRHERGLLELPKLPWPRKKKPQLRVLPDPVPAPRVEAPKPRAPVLPEATMAEVDALLDKIAKSGIGSLTPAERAKLEAARADMLKRGAGKR